MDWKEVERLYYEGALSEGLRYSARAISKIPIRSLREVLWDFVTQGHLDEISKPMDIGFNPEYQSDNYDIYKGKFIEFVVLDGKRTVRLCGSNSCVEICWQSRLEK